MEPENPLLDQYVLAQTKKKKPRVCFVGTAGGDSQGYIDRFYEAFKKLDCEPSHLSLFQGPVGSLESYVMAKDVIYVGGGNTRNLLVLWREWGLDKILRKAWENGIVLAGISAGSICWFDEGVTDSVPGELTSLKCLGLLSGSNCPHYDGEAQRRPSYHALMTAGKIGEGYACDDGVALHYTGDKLTHVISSRPNAKAYRLTLSHGKVVEEAITPHYLGI